MAEKTRAQELHDEYRRKVWEDTKSGAENFDKYLLTFSSGALGLSLAFVKDVVPLKEAIWLGWLFSSWIAFVLCILVTLFSFRISIHALEEMVPCLNEFYLEGKQDAFNKHLKSLWTKAVDWCSYAAIFLFVLGLIFTMMFVGANIRKEAKQVSKKEITEKVTTGDLGKAIKPAAMTPLTEGVKPVAMTPTGVRMQTTDALKPAAMTPVSTGGENRGIKPPAMTPVQPAPAPPAPAPNPKK